MTDTTPMIHWFEQGVPGDLPPLLAEICQTHLPNLAANAAAWQAAPARKQVPPGAHLRYGGATAVE